jgi:hypothetical protein
MAEQFDDIVKGLAAGTCSRRQALRRLGGLLTGSLVASLAWCGRARGDTDANCDSFCSKYSPNHGERAKCMKTCKACPSTAQLCGSSGFNLACCPSGAFCCSNACVNVATDVHNCGACGSVCPAVNGTASCTAGLCGITCNAGFTKCSGSCVNTATDPNHCGGCGLACAAGQSCVQGVCM